MHELEITADINRQTMMAEWCFVQLARDSWGMLPRDLPTEDAVIRMGQWRWFFRKADDLGDFRARWPWTHQISINAWWPQDRLHDMAMWCRANLDGAEVETVNTKGHRLGTFGDPIQGSIDLIHVRFRSVEDQTLWRLVWP